MDQALDENDIFRGVEQKQLIKARLKESKHMKVILRLEDLTPSNFMLIK